MCVVCVLWCGCVWFENTQGENRREKRRIRVDQKRKRLERERMLSRTAIRFFSVQKRTTGLVGVQVLENPRESLIDIYQKTLDTIKVRFFFLVVVVD